VLFRSLPLRILKQPCWKIHVLVQDADDSNAVVRELAEEQVVVFVTEEPNAGKAVPTNESPVNPLPPEIVGGDDEAAHIGVGLCLTPSSFRVVPDLQQPLTRSRIDLSGHELVSVLSLPR